MFRRQWSGLPEDPVFLADLRELGYFVNDVDEIRSVTDPTRYFKFFLTKNERWNERQRFAMHEAIEKIIHDRLETLGLAKIRLPLGSSAEDKHVLIFASLDISTKTRIIVIFGEPTQDLGILAQRVANGRGGLDKGSMVSVVREILSTQTCPEVAASSTRKTSVGPPAVVIANTGQLFWWPEGRRSLSETGRQGAPRASAVHWCRVFDPNKNCVPGNETTAAHIRSVFEAVRTLAQPDAMLDVIAVGDAADDVEEFFDANWSTCGRRLNSLALLGGFYKAENLRSEEFKVFLRERARAYIIHHDPLNFPVAGPEGKSKEMAFTTFGCPVFSAGETANMTELLLIETHKAILQWMQEVASTSGYRNPLVESSICAGPTQDEDAVRASDGWDNAWPSGCEPWSQYGSTPDKARAGNEASEAENDGRDARESVMNYAETRGLSSTAADMVAGLHDRKHKEPITASSGPYSSVLEDSSLHLLTKTQATGKNTVEAQIKGEVLSVVELAEELASQCLRDGVDEEEALE
ncbi:hypothetical protein VTK73DRAFT_2762 [Phialemonium thermophilum]|uniref:Arb2 domain-containing protein n=1 Tax=Phialemonium thermophilum TaxID=223376 RepID=A0ABR3Y1X6_9PEZI